MSSKIINKEIKIFRPRRALGVVVAAFLCATELMNGIPAHAATESKQTVSEAASTIRLSKTEGTVNVQDSVGKDIEVSEKMRLFEGNHVITEQKSYAYFNLDDTKAVKLDAVSDAEIRKKDKNLEVLLHSGNLYFNVSEKLQKNENLNIRASSMVMGIRGTSGSVEVNTQDDVKVSIFRGKITLQFVNPTDPSDIREVDVNAGEFVELNFSPSENEGEPGTITVTKNGVEVENVSGFILAAIYDDDEAEEIYNESGVDFRNITWDQIKDKLSADQKIVGDKIGDVNDKIAGQDNNVSTDNYWENPGGDTGNNNQGGTTPGTPQGNTVPSNNVGGNDDEPTGEGQTGDTPPSTQNPSSDGGQSDDGGSGGDTTEYTIEVNDPTGGTIKSDKEKAKKGDTITLTVKPSSGYKTSSVTVSTSSDDVTTKKDEDDSTKYTFTMPAANVTCKAKFEAVKYKITASNTSNGSVSISPEEAAKGTTVNITTKPDKGYKIDTVTATDKDGKSLSITSDGNDHSFTMPASNVTVKAIFKQKDYNITVNSATGGKVTASKSTAHAGDKITLSISVDSEYQLSGISVKDGDNSEVQVSGEGNSREFTMPYSDVTVTPTFEKMKYSITVESPTNGSLSVTPEGSSESQTTVTITATPNEGYELESIKVLDADNNQISISGSGNTRTFTMPSKSVTISATFKAIDYSITVGSSSHGSISVGSTTAHFGDTISVDASPESDYELSEIVVTKSDGSTVSASVSGNTGSFTMPADNVTVTAVFTQIEHSITVSQVTGGSVSASVSTATAGTSITITATPDEGYEFEFFEVVDSNENSIEPSGSGTSATFTMPSADVTVSGMFRPIDYTISSSFDAQKGSVELSTESANVGDNITVSIILEAAYEVDTVTATKASGGSVSVSGSGTSYSFTMPASNVTVTVTFKARSFSISSGSSITGGSISFDKTQATAGETVVVTVTVAAQDGYRMDENNPISAIGENSEEITLTEISGEDNNGTSGEVHKYSFTMISSNVTVTPNFEKYAYKVTTQSDSNCTISPGYSAELFMPEETLTFSPELAGDSAATGDTSDYKIVVKVTGSDGQVINTYTGQGTIEFTMPSDDITVSAVALPKVDYKVEYYVITDGEDPQMNNELQGDFSYEIRVDGELAQYIYQGETATITISTDSALDYAYQYMTFNGTQISGTTYTFEAQGTIDIRVYCSAQ